MTVVKEENVKIKVSVYFVMKGSVFLKEYLIKWIVDIF